MSMQSAAPPSPITRSPIIQLSPSNKRFLLLGIVATLVTSLPTALVFYRQNITASVFDLSNFIGPTVQSVLRGEGLLDITDLMGTAEPLVYRAARMPLPTYVVAALTWLIGDHLTLIALVKCVLFLMPIWAAMALVWRAVPRADTVPRLGAMPRVGAVPRVGTVPRVRSVQWPIALLLMLPFGITTFLADVVNLQVEEGYSFSLLGFAVAMLVFPESWQGAAGRRSASRVVWALLFAAAVSGLYLSKSSMLLAAAVLLAGFLAICKYPLERALVIVIVCSAPLCWAAHQYAVSGRFSVGTSVDGINFHKGNNAQFLSRYPPPLGSNLDLFDPELNLGQRFTDEWQFNDYHAKQAIEFIRNHPMETLRAIILKGSVAFFSIEKYGSGGTHGLMYAVEKAGIIVFRLVFYAALIFAAWTVLQKRGQDFKACLMFLCLISCALLPYLMGFVYTRHIMVWLFPSVVLLCRAVLTQNVR